MVTLFTERLRRAPTAAGRAALWSREIAGLLRSAVALHLDLLRHDLRWTLRSLRRSPGFALTAIAVAALGIGATTATFSVADYVLVRRLPFPEADRLVKLWEDDSFRGYPRLEPSPADYRDWREQSHSFSAMASYSPASTTLLGQGVPERLDSAQVSASLGEVLGANAWIGRLFSSDDDRSGAAATVVLSYACWRDRFGADRGILNRKLVLDGQPTVVIGVLPEGFAFPSRETQLWIPQRFGPDWYDDRDNNFLRVIARLRPDVSIDAARAELATVATRLATEHPETNAQSGVAVVRLRDELSRESQLLLKALAGAAFCLLLLSCTNLASLLLSRSLARGRELAVRAALGGGRSRLVRQMLTESLLLAGAGGAVGIALAFVATPAVARLVPNSLPIAETPPIDFRLLAVAAALTLATGLGFGLAPALRAPLDASADELREGGRAGVSGGRQRWRRTLVFVEVGLSVALLVSTALLLRSLERLQAVDPGFRSAGVLTLRTWLPRPEYDATEKRHRFYAEVLEQVRSLPGVESAGYLSFLPMTMRGGIWGVKIAGRNDENGEAGSSSVRYASPGALAALSVPFRAGRDVSDSDSMDSEKVAVVSESFARRFFPGEDALGRHFEIAFFERTVVGVVGDIAVRGLGKESEPQVYLPDRQIPDGWMTFYDPKDLAVRTSGSFEPLSTALRTIVARADPKLPITNLRPLAAIVAEDTAPRTAQLRVLGAFAATALLLAGLGLHGLLAYAVSSRRQELGLRVALGASRRGIATFVLRQGVLPAAGGAVAGLGLAAATGRWLSSLLFGVSPFDATAYAVAAVLMLLTALAGALPPTARALRLDPIAALRSE